MAIHVLVVALLFSLSPLVIPSAVSENMLLKVVPFQKLTSQILTAGFD